MYKVVASRTDRRLLDANASATIGGEVVRMELFTFQDIILFATFLITLLAYIDRKNKRK